MNDLDNIIFFLVVEDRKKTFFVSFRNPMSLGKRKKLQTQLSDEAWMKI